MVQLPDIVGNVISGATDLIKSYFPPDMSPEDKAQMQARLAELDQKARTDAMEFQRAMEQQLTERHRSDMQSDSWLSKNIRPLVLMYLMGAWTVFAGFSMYAKEVNPEYVKMLRDMLMAAFGFYFVSRGAEKIVSIVKGKSSG